MKGKTIKPEQSHQSKALLTLAPDVSHLIRASLPARFPYQEIQSGAAAARHQSRWPLLAEAAALGERLSPPERKAS